VQARPLLLKLLIGCQKNDRGFEDALATLHKGDPYGADDIAAMESAVLDTFIDMDSDIGDNHRFRDGEISIHKLQGMLQRFQGPLNSSEYNSSFIVTLNQDLALERHWYNFNHWGMRVCLPGMPNPQGMYSGGRHFFGPDLPAYSHQFDVVVPKEPLLELKSNLNYVKLHGSFNWRFDDGTSTLVMGGSKLEQIVRSPLLLAYHEIFSKVLSGTQKLLVIGYSFQDEHINKVIADAVSQAGLRVAIWDPYVGAIIKRLASSVTGQEILKHPCGTYTVKFHEAFPAAGGGLKESSEWSNIRRQFFEEAN
jgi:hypothetical protein